MHEVAVGEQLGGGPVPASDVLDQGSAFAEAVGDRAQGHDTFLEAVARFLAVETDQGDDAGFAGGVEHGSLQSLLVCISSGKGYASASRRRKLSYFGQKVKARPGHTPSSPRKKRATPGVTRF